MTKTSRLAHSSSSSLLSAASAHSSWSSSSAGTGRSGGPGTASARAGGDGRPGPHPEDGRASRHPGLRHPAGGCSGRPASPGAQPTRSAAGPGGWGSDALRDCRCGRDPPSVAPHLQPRPGPPSGSAVPARPVAPGPSPSPVPTQSYSRQPEDFCDVYTHLQPAWSPEGLSCVAELTGPGVAPGIHDVGALGGWLVREDLAEARGAQNCLLALSRAPRCPLAPPPRPHRPLHSGLPS